MRQQYRFSAENGYVQLDRWIEDTGEKKVLLVCGRSLQSLPMYEYFLEMPRRLGITVIKFSDFSPNPVEESVRKGVEVFKRSQCGVILAVGGGSAIDVAKCIRLYAGRAYLPFAAVPTTAGSGSESTRFAVIYRRGEKQSITDDRCLPDAVLLEPKNLRGLPEYQRKAAMMDAFSHAVESYWSLRATKESRAYSRQALRLLMKNYAGYLSGGEEESGQMLMAAHLAGKAINLAQTTAGHAMSYKLTGLYGIAHGHAAALCVSVLWRYMLAHPENKAEGGSAILSVCEEIAQAMGCAGSMEAAARFQEILDSLMLGVPSAAEPDFALLKASVNQDRLRNHPIRLEEAELEALYRQALPAVP